MLEGTALTISGNVQSPTLAYVNANWLEDPSVGVVSSNAVYLDNTIGGYHWYSPNYCWGHVTHTKIRLALSEVERLRTAARNDAKLKKILAKFAPHIEIVVDFE